MSWALLWHFCTFYSKLPGYTSLVRVEGSRGGEKGRSREISDMLLAMKPIKKKFKQKSLLAAGMQSLLSWPLYTLEQIN